MTDQQLRLVKALLKNGVIWPSGNADKEGLLQWVKSAANDLEAAREFVLELLVEAKHDLTEG